MRGRVMSSWPERMLGHLMPFTSLWHRQQQNCALQPPESFDMVLRLEEQPRFSSTPFCVGST